MQATQGQSGDAAVHVSPLRRHDIIVETVNQTPQGLARLGKLRWHRAVYLYLYIHIVHPVDVRDDRPVLTGGVLVHRHGRLTFDMETSDRTEKPTTEPNLAMSQPHSGVAGRRERGQPPSDRTPHERPMSLGRPKANQPSLIHGCASFFEERGNPPTNPSLPNCDIKLELHC